MDLSDRIRGVRQRGAHVGGLQANSGDWIACIAGFVWVFTLTRCPVGIALYVVLAPSLPFLQADSAMALLALLLLQFALPTVLAYKLAKRTLARRLQNRAEVMAHLCLGCGYDIRGLPDRRCPECGTDF